MTLPSSGMLQASDINVELGRAWNHFFDMNAAPERNLAGKPTGSIGFADFYGKSNLIREPATGESQDNQRSWRVLKFNSRNFLYWGGVEIYQSGTSDYSTSFVVGTWTYYKGAFSGINELGRDIFGIYRVGKY